MKAAASFRKFLRWAALANRDLDRPENMDHVRAAAGRRVYHSEEPATGISTSVLQDLPTLDLSGLSGKVEWMIVAGLDVTRLGVVGPCIRHHSLAALVRQSDFSD